MGEWFPMGEWYPMNRGLPNALLMSGDGAAADLDLHLWSQQGYVDTLAINNQGFGIQLSGHATEIQGATVEATMLAEVEHQIYLTVVIMPARRWTTPMRLLSDGTDTPVPGIQRAAEIGSILPSEDTAIGIFVNQRSLVPLTDGSSTVALSQLRNVRVSPVLEVRIFFSKSRWYRRAGRPILIGRSLCWTALFWSPRVRLLAVDSVVDVVGTENQRVNRFGCLGSRLFGRDCQ